MNARTYRLKFWQEWTCIYKKNTPTNIGWWFLRHLLITDLGFSERWSIWKSIFYINRDLILFDYFSIRNICHNIYYSCWQGIICDLFGGIAFLPLSTIYSVWYYNLQIHTQSLPHNVMTFNALSDVSLVGQSKYIRFSRPLNARQLLGRARRKHTIILHRRLLI